jgi:DNA repair protein RadC
MPSALRPTPVHPPVTAAAVSPGPAAPAGPAGPRPSGRAPRSTDCARCRRTLALPTTDRPRLEDPQAVAMLLLPLVGAADREHCLAVMLDTKHRVLETITVSVGSLDHTFMSPREILRDALLANAAAVVVAHNHPSGDPEPSRDDERVTRRIVEAGRVVGVEVLDHLVVGGGSWVSLARRGLV